MTRVLIAEESPVLREGLAAVLRAEGMAVVGTVSTAGALGLKLEIDQPDVALVGIPMPPAGPDDGLCAIEQMRQQHPGVGVLVLSSYFDPATAVRLVSRRPTSTAYLLKEPVPAVATLVRAVRVVASGGTYVDRTVIARLRAARIPPVSLDHLSDREREILILMAQGRTNSAVCDALQLSPKTVESHVRALFSKLDLRPAPDDHRRVLAVLRYLQAEKPKLTLAS